MIAHAIPDVLVNIITFIGIAVVLFLPQLAINPVQHGAHPAGDPFTPGIRKSSPPRVP